MLSSLRSFAVHRCCWRNATFAVRQTFASLADCATAGEVSTTPDVLSDTSGMC